MFARSRLPGAPLLAQSMLRPSPPVGLPIAPVWTVRQYSTPPSNPHSHSNSHSHSHSHSLADSHGHSHDHSHTHSLTGELLSTGHFRSPAVRITLVGFLTNAGMAAVKFVGGVVFHSQSLIADSVHALSDLVSDVLTLATVSVAKRSPSPEFPHGYGRIEAMGAFGVSSLLLAAGVSMGYGSLAEVLLPFGVTLPFVGHAHSHALPAEWSAAGIALASIGIKEALYQVTKRVADRENSPVLYANAWHHRVDCMVSAVAVASISLGQVMQAAWVDPMGGLVVSALIIRAGYRPTMDALFELSGSVRSIGTKQDDFAAQVAAELQLIAPQYNIKKCALEPYGSTFVGTVQLSDVDGNVEHVAELLKTELMKIEHMRQINITV